MIDLQRICRAGKLRATDSFLDAVPPADLWQKADQQEDRDENPPSRMNLRYKSIGTRADMRTVCLGLPLGARGPWCCV
jgi:hypothetical protein